MGAQTSGQYTSFVLGIKEDRNGDVTFNGRVVMPDGRKIGLADGSYLVRVWIAPEAELMRGTITHERSGQQIHFQSGDPLSEFIHECVYEISDSSQGDEKK